MKTLITDTLQRLDEIEELKYVDIDWGQVDLFVEPYPVKFPCALLEIRQAGYNDEGHLTQRGIVLLEVRLLDMILSNSSTKAPLNQREKAFRLFDLTKDVYVQLHGWNGSEHYGPLTRTTYSKINRDDGLKEYRLQFSVELHDASAYYQKVADKKPTLKINIEGK